MFTYAVVVGVSVGVSMTTILRMRGGARVPALFWITLLLSLSVPIAVGWTVNFPVELSTEVQELRKEKETVSVSIPEGHSLMIDSIPSTEKLNPADPKSFKTDYSITIKGVHNKKIWKQTVSGAMERKSDSEDGKVKVKKLEGEQISGSGSNDRRAGLNENIQDRYELNHPGENLRITLKNYDGKAIDGLSLRVVSSPPPNMILWGLAILFSILGVYFESWKNCDKVAGDIAFLAFYGLFLSQEVAPLDGIKGMLLAAIPAFFMGYAPVAGLAYLANKMNAHK